MEERPSPEASAGNSRAEDDFRSCCGDEEEWEDTEESFTAGVAKGELDEASESFEKLKWLLKAVVTMFNYQQFRHIGAPGWQLGWKWAKKEVIWSMVGAQTTEQGDCSKFKGNTPHCCKKDPTIVDLLPGTTYNMQIVNCCKAGVINTFNQDPANVASSF
ncbi:COBRA-like protein 3 [Zea mays]|uniref:COBRA-like protein 3 n=1 Tax=Zea mays TaxID=4577 RepID=A0A3L6ER05_MAIZE|nr:COBRA-like protein 3 [Zea mays]